ncbi:NADH-quinone oxidoreductase subunit H [bacterium]|jgi:formate hydrogenlyase subunit 4|nr:NADH-quinone oxidoreductase subunit H [bacterium]
MKFALLNIILALIAAPLLSGIINRVKAMFAGRKGQPLFQLYYDLHKLLKKSAVFSPATTFFFWAGPLTGFAVLAGALLIVPQAQGKAFIQFPGDIILFIYLFGLMRFFTVVSAMDTGSSFEGMGASREIQFAVFAEPALFLGLVTLARKTANLSLSGIYSSFSWHDSTVLILVSAAFFIIFLAENSRLPVDDPNTHLELTMIHEVMVLDHSGPDLAVIFYSASLKLWILGSLVIGAIMPIYTGKIIFDELIFLSGMAVLSIVVGIVESCMARLKLLKVPQFLIVGFALAIIALILQIM